jgi:hypothetical protein
MRNNFISFIFYQLWGFGVTASFGSVLMLLRKLNLSWIQAGIIACFTINCIGWYLFVRRKIEDES